ncbi:SH3 domain-containing protein [Janthinobacterium fluminis]|uniref:SH3 domain-containing protein n=1 Tax=Janthinobacterium fluminis TaxID=2987524 RepID=A0ABT5K4N1_9BURK|nr:SH3 domain-containing protein [Janthinobacterium fluminis]MDC8759933.1 SH3 domain-containing protein [Janthinobacterium fluminis]
MQAPSLYPLAGYAAGLLLTLALAAWLTPRRWWRRPTARALLILAGGTWALGALMTTLLPAPPAPPPLAAAPAPVPAGIAGQAFRAHHDLNLRAGAGVNSARIGVVRGGAALTPTGRRDGDWWQVRADIDGRDRVGWASSLWLRQSGEAAPP